MDLILPVLSMLGYWAIILGSLGGPGPVVLNYTGLISFQLTRNVDHGPHHLPMGLHLLIHSLRHLFNVQGFWIGS